jgi:DNA-binding NarL/FixJ family response regulator
MVPKPLTGNDQCMPTHLLIVDDSDLVRSSMRTLLGTVAGIDSIREAATLEEAMESVRRDPPTLAILDMYLPDGLGMHIIQPLKQLAPALLIAMLTIHANHSVRKACLVRGADWFFDKSGETDDLLDLIRQHAARSTEPADPA